MAVADIIGIDMEVVNFCRRIQRPGVSLFSGRIRRRPHPNPDVLCNAEIKFKAFLDYAVSLERRSHRHRPLRLPGGQPARRQAAQRRRPQQRPKLFLYRLQQPHQLRRRCFRWANCTAAGARDRQPDQTAQRPQKTAPASALSANGRSANSCSATCPPSPVRWSPRKARWWVSITGA